MSISMKAVAAMTFIAVLYPLHESLASPAVPPIEAFARLPAIEHPRISPEGDKLAYFRLLEGEPTLIIQGLDGSGLMTVPDGQDFRYLWVEWANNDRLVFSIGFAAARRTVETQETRLAAIDSDGSDFAFIVKADTEVPLGSRIASRELPPPQIQDRIVSWLPDEPHHFDDEYGVLQKSVDRVLKDTTNRLVSASEDRQKIILEASADTQPTIYYLWDRDQGQIAIVAETRPDLTAEVLSPMEPVTYEARDGVTIPAYLTRPGTASGDEPLPAVVLPHGGPHVRTSRDFNYLRQFLASRGYVVFEPNFRGSGGYGEAWRAAGEHQWGGLMQDDVTDGARWLVEAGIADPERLCIVGGSYGGYAAMMGAIKTPDLYRCAVSINGALDLPHLIMEARNYIGGREWTKSIGLSDEKAAAVSPHDRADEIDIPVLVIQTADDRVVPPDQAQRFVDRLRGLDKDVRFEWLEAGGHDVYDAEARLRILEALEKFLAATIGTG